MGKLRIGITSDAAGVADLPESFAFYRDSIQAAGGQPIPVTYGPGAGSVGEVLDQLDGVLFSGGDDLDPSLWGETWNPNAKPVNPLRQAFELALLAEAECRRMPILGICLGCQLMNVHRKGSLIQFLPEYDRPNALEHRKLNGVVLRHGVAVEPGSRLGAAVGRQGLSVNTYHKQAIGRVGQNLRVVARASDGIIEGIEDPTMPLFLGVQWHPERISNEPEHAAVFRMLVGS